MNLFEVISNTSHGNMSLGEGTSAIENLVGVHDTPTTDMFIFLTENAWEDMLVFERQKALKKFVITLFANGY